MSAAVQEMVRNNGYKRVGLLYQDDDYGLEVMKGSRRGWRGSARRWSRRPATSAAPPTSPARSHACARPAATSWCSPRWCARPWVR